MNSPRGLHLGQRLAAFFFFFGTIGLNASAEVLRVPSEPAQPPAMAAKRAALESWRGTSTHLQNATKLALEPIARARIEFAKRQNSDLRTKGMQIGVGRESADELPAALTTGLDWQTLDNGSKVAYLTISSPGALGLRLGLKISALPHGLELRVHGNGEAAGTVAYADEQELQSLRDGRGLYWTALTEGDQQIVEIYLPAGSPAGAYVTLISTSHVFASPRDKFASAKSGSQSCEVNVMCPTQTTGFVNARNAVAHMVFQVGSSSYVCTGTLLNDTDTSTQIPYFYSANHCLSDQPSASTLNTYWFYEDAQCVQATDLTRSQATRVTGGATLLYNDTNSDVLFLRLNAAPPSGAVFAGWDANTISAGTAMTVIHHPAGDVKKVSLGQVLGLVTGVNSLTGSFIQVGYTSGSTEGGSSGSGLLTQSGGSYYFRGGLYAGSADCSNTGNLNDINNHDYYSRFDLAYPSIKQYLSPAAAPANTLNVALLGTGYGTVSSSPAGISCGTTCSASLSGTVVLTASPATGSSFSGWSGACSGTGTCTVTLSSNLSVTATFTVNQYSVARRGGIDLDGNGKADIVLRAANSGNLQIGTLVGNTFQFSTRGDPGPSFRLVGIGDFDGDGVSDLAFQNIVQDPTFGDVRMWPKFQPNFEVFWRQVKKVWDVQAVGDLDGDGYGDLVWRYVVTDSPDTGVSYIWFTNGNGVTQVRKRGGAPLTWKLLGAMDLNADGAADMIYVSPDGIIKALMATPNRTCANLSAGNIPVGFTPLKLADFTGNGRADILLRNGTTGAVQLISLNASGLALPAYTGAPDDQNASCTASNLTVASSTTSLPTTGTSWQFYASGDFDGDGITDVVWLLPDNTLTVWLMKPNGGAPTTFSAGSAPAGYTVFQP